MYCSNCGAEIHDEAVICIHCGKATHNHAPRVVRETNPLALIGFILSFFFQIAGLICSIIAYRRCKDNPNLEGKGLALAGLLISAITIALAVLGIIILVVILVVFVGSIPDYPETGELARILTMLIK